MGWDYVGGWGNPGQWDWFNQKLPQGLLQPSPFPYPTILPGVGMCVCVWVGGWLPCRVGGVGEGRGLRVWKPPGAVRVWQSRPDNCFLSWHLSQLAHAIRLLLEYTDSNYEEKKYTMGDGNSILFMS